MRVRVSAETKITGLFGHPIKHSASPMMHNAAFEKLGLDYIYLPFDVKPNDLKSAVDSIKALNIVGVNVTIPHKNNIISYLDSINDDARSTGSVNTVHNDNGELKGYSTDGEGFLRSLGEIWKYPDKFNAVVVGAGGSARATIHALLKSGAEVKIVNRTRAHAVDIVESMKKCNRYWQVESISNDLIDVKNAIDWADLLVNCTSVGMYPNINNSPVPCDMIHKRLFVYDQIYNPAESLFLKTAKEKGCSVSNGLMMLVYQGAISFEIWTGYKPSVSVMKNAIINHSV